jgi:DNA-binding transcriptional regulator YiaG
MTGRELREWRKRTGYSQIWLANALGVTNVCVSRWETGVREIPSFLGLALEALEARGGEKRPRATETKTRKGVKHG